MPLTKLLEGNRDSSIRKNTHTKKTPILILHDFPNQRKALLLGRGNQNSPSPMHPALSDLRGEVTLFQRSYLKAKASYSS